MRTFLVSVCVSALLAGIGQSIAIPDLGPTATVTHLSNLTSNETVEGLGAVPIPEIDGCGTSTSEANNPVISDCSNAILKIPSNAGLIQIDPGVSRGWEGTKCRIELRNFGATDTFTWPSIRFAASQLAIGCQKVRDKDWTEPRTLGTMRLLGTNGNLRMRIGKKDRLPGGWPNDLAESDATNTTTGGQPLGTSSVQTS